VNVPLVDDLLAVRLSGSVTSRDGTLTNQFTGKKQNNRNSYLLRGQLLLTPSSSVSIRLIGDYAKQKQDCCAQVLAGIVAPANGKNFRNIAALFGYTPVIDPFARVTVNDRAVAISNESGGVSAQIDIDLPGATLTSISAWRFWNWDPVNDLDFTPLSVFSAADNVDKQNQYSQELRIASRGSNKVDYVAGLFLFDETISQHLTVGYGPAATQMLVSPALPALILNGVSKVDTNRYHTTSLAAYGQATIHLTDALSLTGGLRYSHDNKRGNYSAVASGGFPLAGPLAAFAPIRAAFATSGAFDVQSKVGKVSGAANLSYRVNNNVMVYTSYSRGNRSGGLNLTQLATGISPVVAPESIDAYEVGLKTSLLDNRLTFNLAGYLQNDRNYQANVADPTRLAVVFLSNVPKVRSKGIEVDMQGRLSDNISVYGALAYTDAKIVSYPASACPLELTNLNTCDLSGYAIAGIPKWSASFGGEVKQPVTVFDAPSEAYLGLDYSEQRRLFCRYAASATSLGQCAAGDQGCQPPHGCVVVGQEPVRQAVLFGHRGGDRKHWPTNGSARRSAHLRRHAAVPFLRAAGDETSVQNGNRARICRCSACASLAGGGPRKIWRRSGSSRSRQLRSRAPAGAGRQPCRRCRQGRRARTNLSSGPAWQGGGL
jgi:iron complex outermembrane receptor protein